MYSIYVYIYVYINLYWVGELVRWKRSKLAGKSYGRLRWYAYWSAGAECAYGLQFISTTIYPASMGGIVCIVCPFADDDKLNNIHVDLALLVCSPSLLSTHAALPP